MGITRPAALWRTVRKSTDDSGDSQLAQLSRLSGPAAEFPPTSGMPIAVIGTACRFPDADCPEALLDVALSGRRAFRRLPLCRIDLPDYYSADPATPDATYSTRAALVEGWQFDRAAFGVAGAAFRATDPAHWLALETAARALAAAGFPRGRGLDRGRTGVIIGNTLGGEVSRATAIRLRWPYVRRCLADALHAAGLPAERADLVVQQAAARFLAPFPGVGAETLTGGLPSAIAARICGYFGFLGGGHVVDSDAASGLLAIAAACRALASGDLDVVIAGGVDVSLDPLQLVGLAKSGALATGEVRVYDESPTGFLPGEGCGMFVLVRAADAVVANVPVLAEIAGWGVASAGQAAPSESPGALPGMPDSWLPAPWAGLPVPEPSAQLIALLNAHQQAGIEPGEVRCIEGDGAGTPAADQAELIALAELRAGAREPAGLSSVKANIGHTGAAAGAAALAKAVMSIRAGVIPPATGVSQPHPLLRDGEAALRLADRPEPWPDGTRIAGVTSVGTGECVHLLLRADPETRSGRGFGSPGHRLPPRAPSGPVLGPQSASQPGERRAGMRNAGRSWTAAFLLHAADRRELVRTLERIAAIAPWISDGEFGDLAVQLASAARGAGPVRVTITASRQEQLSRLAREAAAALPGIKAGQVLALPGIFAAEETDGLAALLLSGAQTVPDQPAEPLPGLDTLRWLNALGVRAGAAVAEGSGEYAGLVWAGCLDEASAMELQEARAEILSRRAVRDPDAERQSREVAAAAVAMPFAPPQRRLFLASTGTELTVPDNLADMLIAGPPASEQIESAVRAGTAGASLLISIGSGDALPAAAARLAAAPVISAGDGILDSKARARAAAALFAAGALRSPDGLYAGLPARSFDIWRDQIFIVNPCQARPELDVVIPVPERPAALPEPAPRPAARPSAAARPTPAAPAAGVPPVPGIGPWARCFTERLRPLDEPATAPAGPPWRVRSADPAPFSSPVAGLFPDDPAAGCVLALAADPSAAACNSTLLAAAREALHTRRLVVITHGPSLTGFLASVYAEYPELGITVLRVPESAAGLRAARRYAAAEPGRFRELVIDAAGRAQVPYLGQAVLRGGGSFPLGPGDVVLVDGGAGGAGLALARVLACCGAPIAIIGEPAAGEAGQLAAALETLRQAGARLCHEAADPADPREMAAALLRIERRLGPVTAIAVSAGAGVSHPVDELSGQELCAHVAAATTRLEQLLGALRLDRLRLLMTFGSIVSRYGLAGESALALAGGALAQHAERLVHRAPGCRALHIDWAPWSGHGLGQRAELAANLERSGATALSPEDGSRLLLKVLASPGAPGRLAIHGRIPADSPVLLAAQAPATDQQVRDQHAADGQRGRFTGTVRLHYPGIELVCEASLSASTDPYLADYQVDGLTVLPPVMALEAMAQAASMLAGEPVREANDVTVSAPVVVPAGSRTETTVRICALRDGDSVTAVLRSSESGFGTDHIRAGFRCGGSPAPLAATPMPELGEIPASHAGIVDGTELYGQVWFQSGRFQRVALLHEITASSCRALARGADERPWFHTGSAAGSFALGDPGLADAALQLAQACVPHQRLMLSGCRSVAVSGREATGAIEIRAVQAGEPGAVPQPRRPPTWEWDAEAVDGTGEVLVSWRGARFTDAGPVLRSTPWPPGLLACYLQRRATELGLDPRLEVRIAESPQPGTASAGSGAGEAPVSQEDGAPGTGELAGFRLTVRAPGGLAGCGWASAGAAGWPPEGALGQPPDGLAEQLRGRLGEPGDVLTARLHAIAACLSGVPVPGPLTIGQPDGAWIVLHGPAVSVACTVVAVSAVAAPVAIALLTGDRIPEAGPAGASSAAASPGAKRPGHRNAPSRATAPGLAKAAAARTRAPRDPDAGQVS
jgi:3-oxoacyl-(acyl-carrier-protein) synthase